MRDINIYALDNQLNMIAILKPTNIQWSRKYYENGYFSILLPLEQYSKEIAYIYIVCHLVAPKAKEAFR